MYHVGRVLAENSGFDVQDTILKLSDEREATDLAVGLDVSSGEVMIPANEGIWDNVRVKRQCLYLATVCLANQLLLVDEVMKAGKQMGRNAPLEMTIQMTPAWLACLQTSILRKSVSVYARHAMPCQPWHEKKGGIG